MPEIYPFQAVMPTVEKVAAVASPPYDVVSFEEARALTRAHPSSFLRVLRSEIDLPPATDPDSPAVYDQARATYQEWREDGTLVQTGQPAMYVYSLTLGEHRQTGLAVLGGVDDYQHNLIRKHEKTRAKKEDDRTRHILTLMAHTGLVFLTCPEDQGMEAAFAEVMRRQPPIFDFTAADGVGHALWRVDEDLEASLQEIARAMPAFYIADGHHRAAAAARARDELQKANPQHSGSEEYNRFPVVVFPAGQLRVLPYNRLIKDLRGQSSAEVRQGISEIFTIQPTTRPEPRQRGDIHMYLGGQWYGLRLRREQLLAAASVVDRLDVSILQNFVLAPVLGIEDPRTDSRIDFVGGIRGTAELVKRVDSGEYAIAFSMFPTTVEQLIEIADAGSVMPPKSTWFEPKLRDGLLVHEI